VAPTDSDHNSPTYPNPARDVVPNGLNQLWVGDITYIAFSSGFVHLAAILDAWSRRVVGYDICRRIDGRPTLAALRVVIAARNYSKRNTLGTWSDPPPECVRLQGCTPDKGAKISVD
jgi:transposase InsO family protein